MGCENISEIIPIISIFLAILSMIFSAFIAYDLYWSEGDIEVFMPDEVNLDKLQVLIVHTTFSNDGAPPTNMIIKDITAKAWIHQENKPVEEIQFKWVYTNYFMSKREFERLYPNEINNYVGDYIEYEGRKAPFTVQGKTTVSKLLQFHPLNNYNFLSEPFTISIQIIATTMNDRTFISEEKEYVVDGTKLKAINDTGAYIWIFSKDSQIK